MNIFANCTSVACWTRAPVVHLRGGLIRGTYDACEGYIRAKREAQGRTELYLRFEELAKELAPSA